MRTTERQQLPLRGQWKLTARHIATGEIIEKEGWNLIVTVGKTLLAEILTDQPGYDTGFTYQAIGTSNTAVNVADTQLTTETARQIVTSRTFTTGQATFTTFFTAAQSTYNIKEGGMFGHSTASGTANSGVLFSHWLVSFDNSGGLYDLTFTYILTIG